ncbi:transglycosylase SLT domain protein [Citrobacter amalonaticus]|uniref:Transglycosylase SLT domain protein n=1 Tax=Citrobacter amalonaticus TaxID=35703 RepID=A0A2S4S2K8_CITAM|nr:lytic transglycosylase domain-containing protein [Citrobacter amalonaticus]POT59497.1 transglycosylase SLT domain protein [Citrobacter amalonaticus]POT77627.1 transglycosylase SLT domain protein [Citrobacter amalonaticus]POU68079.1 transglycosylase SLT domain protein [Citrobacter amalonaticus]POV07683.1 transglycosylase SLT domain protein [Citrobacter amalonaticus]
MSIARWIFILLATMPAMSNLAWAKSYCYTDPQKIIRISTMKRGPEYKPCMVPSSLAASIRKKMKKKADSAIRVAGKPGTRGQKSNVMHRPEITRYVREQAERYNVDPHLVNAIISEESGYKQNAVSSKGALGLMQLMPATAKELAKGERLNIKREHLFDPEINISLGVKYLAELGDRYDNNLELVLAAYHAGIGNVAQYDNKVPPFKSTRRYVRNVTCRYNSNHLSCGKSDF